MPRVPAGHSLTCWGIFHRLARVALLAMILNHLNGASQLDENSVSTFVCRATGEQRSLPTAVGASQVPTSRTMFTASRTFPADPRWFCAAGTLMALRSLSPLPFSSCRGKLPFLYRPARLQPIGTTDAPGRVNHSDALTVCLSFASIHRENALQDFPTIIGDQPSSPISLGIYKGTSTTSQKPLHNTFVVKNH